jgi:hypothetical protein
MPTLAPSATTPPASLPRPAAISNTNFGNAPGAATCSATADASTTLSSFSPSNSKCYTYNNTASPLTWTGGTFVTAGTYYFAGPVTVTGDVTINSGVNIYVNSGDLTVGAGGPHNFSSTKGNVKKKATG